MIIELNGVNVHSTPLAICNCAELELVGPYIGYIYQKESRGYYIEILENGTLVDTGHFEDYDEAEKGLQEAIQAMVEN